MEGAGSSRSGVNLEMKQAFEQEPIRTRAVSWPVIVLFVAVSSGVLLLVPVLQRVGPLQEILGHASLRSNLLVFAALLIFVVVGVIFGVGRLRPADVGLRWEKLREGVIVTVAVWSLMQLVEVAGDLASGGTIKVASDWMTFGIWPTLAWTAVMFLGAGLYEEIAYRGFLFPQLYLKIHGTHHTRLLIAILISEVLFAAGHIPAHITLRHLSGSALYSTLALQGIVGVLLVLLYLRTRNLWICIGIHGLANAPTPLVSGAGGFETFLIILIVGWPWIARRPQHRSFARVESLIPAVQPDNV